jgi:hypothetical protein
LPFHFSAPLDGKARREKSHKPDKEDASQRPPALARIGGKFGVFLRIRDWQLRDVQ